MSAPVPVSRQELNTHLQVLDEVGQLLENLDSDEFKAIQTLGQLKRSVAEQGIHKELAIDRAIQSYMLAVKDLEQQIKTATATKNTKAKQQDIVKAQIMEGERTVTSLTEEIEENENTIKDLNSRLESIDAEKKARDTQAATELPMARQLLRLYMTATNTVFDRVAVNADGKSGVNSSTSTINSSSDSASPSPSSSSSSSSSDIVSGEVHLTESGQIKRFSFSKDLMSSTEISNKIWDVMWVDVEAKALAQQAVQAQAAAAAAATAGGAVPMNPLPYASGPQ